MRRHRADPPRKCPSDGLYCPQSASTRLRTGTSTRPRKSPYRPSSRPASPSPARQRPSCGRRRSTITRARARSPPAAARARRAHSQSPAHDFTSRRSSSTGYRYFRILSSGQARSHVRQIESSEPHSGQVFRRRRRQTRPHATHARRCFSRQSCLWRGRRGRGRAVDGLETSGRGRFRADSASAGRVPSPEPPPRSTPRFAGTPTFAFRPPPKAASRRIICVGCFAGHLNRKSKAISGAGLVHREPCSSALPRPRRPDARSRRPRDGPGCGDPGPTRPPGAPLRTARHRAGP